MYGLKGKMRETVEELNALRDPGPGNIAQDVTLRQLMAKKFKGADGNPLGVNHLFAELGIEENLTTVHEAMKTEDGCFLVAELIRESARRGMGLAQRDQLAELKKVSLAGTGPITGEHAGGQRFVSPEVFLDPVSRGAVQGTFYPDLVIREIPVAQPQAVVPRFDLSDAALADSHEAATAEEGTISYDTKTVTLTKRSKAIKITDEAVKFSSLSLLQVFMEDFGRLLGNTLNGDAVNCLINDSLSSSAESAAVVGVADTTPGLTYADLVAVAIRFGLIGHVGSQIIANETMANKFLNLAEIKNRYQGTPLVPVQIKTPFQLPTELFISSKVAANKVIIQDPTASMVQLTAQPLVVETERIAMKQITGTIMSIYTGFAKVQRKASVVVDQSVTIGSAPFPSFMTPAA